MSNLSTSKLFDIIYVSQRTEAITDQKLLESFARKTTITFDPKDAIVAILATKDCRPTIVLIDVDHHLAFLERLNQMIQYESSLNIILLACSGRDTAALFDRCIQLGARHFIRKPFNDSTLTTVFRNLHDKQKMMSNSQIDSTRRLHSVLDSPAWSKFRSNLTGLYLNEVNHRLASFSLNIQKTAIKSDSQTSITPCSLSSERRAFLDRFLCEWEFSPFLLSEAELAYCVFSMLNQTFSQFPELMPLKLDYDAILMLISNVRNSYNSNPYHNYKHAVDVMQTTWYFLRSIDVFETVHSTNDSAQLLKGLLQPIDMLALLMASLGHDVGHPGVNNNFMVAIASPLALLYDDKSVLENYHSTAFFNLLENFYANLGIELRAYSIYDRFRKTIIQSILCTDMSQHHDYIKSFKSQVDRARTDSIAFSDAVSLEKERLLVCSAIMKCADISNCTRPFDLAKKWALVLSEELFLQGDLEQELGLPSVPIHQRGKLSLADFQLSFMKNMAFDLYQVMSELFPEMMFCLDTLNENIECWVAFQQPEEET